MPNIRRRQRAQNPSNLRLCAVTSQIEESPYFNFANTNAWKNFSFSAIGTRAWPHRHRNNLKSACALPNFRGRPPWVKIGPLHFFFYIFWTFVLDTFIVFLFIRSFRAKSTIPFSRPTPAPLSNGCRLLSTPLHTHIHSQTSIINHIYVIVCLRLFLLDIPTIRFIHLMLSSDVRYHDITWGRLPSSHILISIKTCIRWYSST